MTLPQETSLEPYWIPEDENTIYVADLSTKVESSLVIDLNSDEDNNESENSNPGITKAFLKKLGVRVAPPAPVLIFQLTSGHIRDPESALKNLYDHRNDLHEEDWKQLKQAQFLQCDKYSKNGSVVRQVCAPKGCFLHLSHLKLKNKFDNKTETLYDRIMKHIGYRTKCNIFVHFEKPPSFELVSFMEDKLDIHAFPSVGRLFTNRLKHDFKYEDCLRFFMAFYKLFYESHLERNPDEKDYAIFLSENGTLHPANELCVTQNPICPIIHPFVVATADKYAVSLKQLGVREQPLVKDILDILKKSPEFYITLKNAPQILSSLSEVSMSHTELKKLKQIPFIPAGKALYLKCKDVLVPEYDVDNQVKAKWTELFPYLDFGAKANEFLVSCGAKYSPSPSDLADAFIRGNTCRNYFLSAEFNAENYIDLMKHLSINLNSLNKSTIKKLQQSSSFLAMDSRTSKLKLVSAKECFLIDNEVWKEIVKPLCAPETNDSLLNELYIQMGSRWLSSAVQEDSKPVGHPTTNPTTVKLSKLISSRYPLFTHTKTGELLPYIKEADLKNLKVKQVKAIQRVLTFKNETFEMNHSEDISMCIIEDGTLYIYEGSDINYFDVGSAISKLITSNALLVEERGTMIAQLLQTPLRALSARGWAIQRILGVDTTTVHNNLTNANKDPLPMEVDASVPDTVDTQVRISDFSKTNSATELRNVIKQSKSFNNERLNPSNQIQNHAASYAADDCMVDIDIQIDKTLKSKGIQLYRTPNAKQKLEGKWLEAYHAFYDLLKSIVSCIPSLTMRSCKIFVDKDSNRIAFNFNCALFFNLRYYYQCHFSSPQYSETKAMTSWFVTLCHELAHNKESLHNKEHERIMEELIIEYMPKLAHNNVVVLD